ncbi:MAG: flagellar accessory protein FlaH [Anaerolineae bacterium]|nr:flagellar accessory protein FlaH [Anaerolineae bacterium]
MSSTDTPTQRTAISSGNVELDSKLGGGIPVGSLVMIEGNSGTGKSVLTQQLIKGSLQTGFRVTLFTTENTPKSLVKQMQSIDLDILDFLLLGKCKVYPIELSQLKHSAANELLRAITSLPITKDQQSILVLDSITSLVTQGSNSQVVHFFEECKRLCSTGMTIMLTLHSSALNNELINPLRAMCDAHLRLNSAQDGQRLVKTLEVAKVRGAASVTGAIVGFEVEPGWGVRVIPISKARG